MSRSGRHNEKSRKDISLSHISLSHDNSYDGTSARTRPLSFDEIMLRRKNKKLSEDVKVAPIEASILSRDNVGENGSNSSQPGKSKEKPNYGTEKCLQEETLKLSSRKKRENTLMKEDNADKGNDREDSTVRRRDRKDNTVRRKDREDITVKAKDRENRESALELKDKLKKDSVSKAKDGSGTDNQFQGRRRNDEHFSNTSEKKAEKRHSRDFADKDKYSDRNRAKSERENSKRRYRDEDDETNRDKNMKKHESGRHNDYEIPDRKHDYNISKRKERKESSKSHYEETRLKRRRSRSREHEKDRNRRSTSSSPKEQRRSFYNRRDHGEAASHTLKERSGRQPSDVDRGRISSNGSSSHYRRHGGSTSGLGGYSPRKRRTEAAIKTPSPIHRSPEKKNAGWDFPPTGTDSKLTSSVLPNLSSSNPTVSTNVHESVGVVPVALSTAKPLAGVSPVAILTKKSSSDSVQLTQATRPMRRLYIENLPASATEKAVMDCVNNFLLSLDVNHVHGAHSCISCTIHKEKGQALVEFLTPEDASAALSFDGSSFCGSILKIRRPKDFVDVATGNLDKSVAAVNVINDTVQDSPHKIFVGGISKALSSKMVMEIVSAFGPLKAYHFEVNNGQPCAFLEYVDQSVTLKACAGLSGMKLGGQVLTAVQAVRHASSMETTHKTPFYGIPEHAEPLLKQPSQVLKLTNVFNADYLSSLPESEVEEVLEDIRLECSRFGAVQSINIIKQSSSPIASPEACTITEINATICSDNSIGHDKNAKSENSEDVLDHEPGVSIELSSRNNKEIDQAVKGDCIVDDKPVDDLEEAKLQLPELSMVAEESACETISKSISPEHPSQISTLKDCADDQVSDVIHTGLDLENKMMTKDDMTSDEGDENSKDALSGPHGSMEVTTETTGKGDIEKLDPQCGRLVFERGSVFVEFRRTEASCMAAHSLHGRTFGDQIVTVEYVDVDLYKTRFPK